MIDLTPPSGYDIKGIGRATGGDWYADLSSVTENGTIEGPINYIDNDENTFLSLKIILEKKPKREVIIFESTGDFREPNEGEYFRMNDGYPRAIGYKHNDLLQVGDKEIFRCIGHTIE